MKTRLACSHAFLPLLLTLSLAACDDSTVDPSVEGAGGTDTGGSPAGGTAGDSSTGGTSGDTGDGGMGGSDSKDEVVGDVSLPLEIRLGSAIKHQLELELDGTTISEGLTWELIDGALPDGVTLSPDGLLEGKPLQAGVFKFRLRATGSDFIAISDVEWEIEGHRWLAYVGSTADETNLFLLNTALIDPTPIAVFDAEHDVQKILASEFSPGNRRYLSVLTKTQSGTQAYIIDTLGPDAFKPTPVSTPNSSAIFWSASGQNWGYFVHTDFPLSEIFVNDESVGVYEHLANSAFIDDDHLIVTTHDDYNTGIESLDLESKDSTGTSMSPVSPAELRWPAHQASSYLFGVVSPSGHDFYWLNTSGATKYLTSISMGSEALFSPDGLWTARHFPAGKELENHLTGKKLSLSDYPDFATFSPDSRWFMGVRDTFYPLRELIIVDLHAQAPSEAPLPNLSSKFTGFCSNWVDAPSRFAAATTTDGSLHFFDFGWDGDHFPEPIAASTDGAITTIDSFACTRDGAALTVVGTTPSRRTAEIYDAAEPLAAPRDLLADAPTAALVDVPRLSLDGATIAFKVTDGDKQSLQYTRATRAPSKAEHVLCGEDVPCQTIGWFQFQL